MRAVCCPSHLRSGALVWLLGALLYGGSLGHGFAVDDQAAIRDNPIVHRGGFLEVWTSDYWAGYHGDHSGLYRPLTVWSFALQYALTGPTPFPYHLVNLLLHASVALLVYACARRLTRREDLAVLSGVISASHPVLSEAVAGLVGRADLLAALLGLVALQQHLRARETRRPYLWAALALLAALLSKESAIVVPALLLLSDLFQYRVPGAPSLSQAWVPGRGVIGDSSAQPPQGTPVADGVPIERGGAIHGSTEGPATTGSGVAGTAEPARPVPRAAPAGGGPYPWLRAVGTAMPSCACWPAYLLYTAVVLLYIGWRWWVLGGLGVPLIDPLDNPLVALDQPLRLLNALLVVCRYLGLLVAPVRLSADYSLAALPLVEHLWSVELLAVLAAVAGLCALLVLTWRLLPWACYGLTWLLMALGPVANLFLPIGTIMAERVLYLPAVGWAMAMAALLLALGRRRARLVAVLLVALYSVRTLERVGDWRDQYTLFSRAVEAYPGSARAWHYLGQAALARGDAEMGLRALDRALEILPTYYEVYNDLGAHYFAQGDYPTALAAFRQCLEQRRDFPPGWLNLGLCHYRLGQQQEAGQAFAHALELDPRYAQAHYSLGVVLLEEGSAQEAAEHFRQVLALEPAQPEARHNLEAATRLLEGGRLRAAPATGQNAPRNP